MKFKKQKYINLIVFILATGFLSGCGDSSGDRVATDPTDHTPHKEKVYLKESFTGGHVSSIDFQVLLPSGTKQSLLEYNGQVSITGSIQMNKTLAPCCERVTFLSTVRLNYPVEVSTYRTNKLLH